MRYVAVSTRNIRPRLDGHAMFSWTCIHLLIALANLISGEHTLILSFLTKEVSGYVSYGFL